MEILCLDTEVVIDYIRDKKPCSEWADNALRRYSCCVTSITIYELKFGIVFAGRKDAYASMLAELPVLNFEQKAALIAGEIHAKLCLNRQDIGPKDVFIASICIANNCALLTKNKKHFERVKNLKLLSPQSLQAA